MISLSLTFTILVCLFASAHMILDNGLSLGLAAPIDGLLKVFEPGFPGTKTYINSVKEKKAYQTVDNVINRESYQPRKDTFRSQRHTNKTIEVEYELWGTGPRLIVWVLGLGGQKEAKLFRVREFPADQATHLLLNNSQGTIEEMAGDIAALVRMISEPLSNSNNTNTKRWSEVDLVGTSMGGMILQHLAVQSAELWSKYVFISTTSDGSTLWGPYFRTQVRNKIKLGYQFVTGKGLFKHGRVDNLELVSLLEGLSTIFTTDFLCSADEDPHADAKFDTNLERIIAAYYKSKEGLRPRSRDRSAHHLLTAFMTFASILRHKAPLGLKEAVVGKQCMIIHGERDPVIPMSGGRSLYKKLGGDGGDVTLVHRAGKSHSVLPEDREAREVLKEFLLGS